MTHVLNVFPFRVVMTLSYFCFKHVVNISPSRVMSCIAKPITATDDHERSVNAALHWSLTNWIHITRRVRPPNGGRNEANSWETGSEYSSGETYTAAAMRAAGRRRPRRAPTRRPAPTCGFVRPAGPRWPLHAGIYQRRSRRIG